MESMQPSNTTIAFSKDPRVPDAHLFNAGAHPMLLSVPDGAILAIDKDLAELLDQAMNFGDAQRVEQFLALAGIRIAGYVEVSPAAEVPVRSLSLAVAQKCNLGCTYCYAQQGSFGGAENNMTADVARDSVDQLLKDTVPGDSVSLAFLGGEPLVNRSVLRAATEYAAELATARSVAIAFALTTNATLLTPDDAEFFSRHRFTVTISMDGAKETHDRLRPLKSGGSSHARVVEGVKTLLASTQRRTRISARVSVTPENLNLRETLRELLALGFDDALFSPVLNSPTQSGQMDSVALDSMLAELMDCGRYFEESLRANQVVPLLNVVNTLRRIHNRVADAYPCGAGGGYLGVSSNGKLFACHRFVDDDVGEMGSLNDGIDVAKRRKWLMDRNVHMQEPCRACWARHLCGGGCHYETIHRGRPACDYIRGWLHYCLGLYARLIQDPPNLLHRILN